MATAVAIAVYGFGSYALTGLAQGMAQNLASMGERASQQVITSEGRADTRKGLASGLADASTINPNIADNNFSLIAGGYGGMLANQTFNSLHDTHTGETLANSHILETAAKFTGIASGAGKEGEAVRTKQFLNKLGKEASNENIEDYHINLAMNKGNYVMPADKFKDTEFYNTMSADQKEFFNQNSGDLVAISGVTFMNNDSIATQTIESNSSRYTMDNSSGANAITSYDDSNTVNTGERISENVVSRAIDGDETSMRQVKDLFNKARKAGDGSQEAKELANTIGKSLAQSGSNSTLSRSDRITTEKGFNAHVQGGVNVFGSGAGLGATAGASDSTVYSHDENLDKYVAFGHNIINTSEDYDDFIEALRYKKHRKINTLKEIMI